jgi:DNA polymerase-3 subunit delta'
MVGEQENEDFNFRTLQDWLRLCFKKDVISLIQTTDELSKIGRERQKSLLSYALRVTRRCLLFNFRLERLVKLEGDEYNFVQKLSPFINQANGHAVSEEFNKAIYHIERNANAKMVFLDLSFSLVKLMQVRA